MPPMPSFVHLFYPRGLLVFTNEEWVLRTWAGSAAVPWPGCWFWVVLSWLSAVPLVWAETSWSLCSLLSPSHPSLFPGVLFPGAGAEAGQAEPARQAVLGRAACAPALAEQGVQSLLLPHTAFPVLLLPGK